MSMDMLYAILFCIAVIGLIIGLKYVTKNRKIETSTIEEIKIMFDIGTTLALELGLSFNGLLITIKNIVDNTLIFAKENLENDSELNTKAYTYALSLCDEAKLKLTDDQKKVLKDLIDIGINKIDLIQI